MLKIDSLKVSYGGIEAVKGITFEVPERKIITLIGATVVLHFWSQKREPLAA